MKLNKICKPHQKQNSESARNLKKALQMQGFFIFHSLRHSKGGAREVLRKKSLLKSDNTEFGSRLSSPFKGGKSSYLLIVKELYLETGLLLSVLAVTK
jgi:hypothetical protein